MVLDMATAVVARSRIRQMLAAARHEIPDGWALDRRAPDHRSAAAIAGSVLPIGGAKGYGLALLVELLCSALRTESRAFGITYENVVKRPSGIGHFFLAIDPEGFGGAAAFGAGHSISRPRSRRAGRSRGVAAPRLPGRRAKKEQAERKAHGIPIAANLKAALKQIGGHPGEHTADKAGNLRTERKPDRRRKRHGGNHDVLYPSQLCGFACCGQLSLIALLAGPSSAQAKDPIEVGSVAALTGYLAAYDANFLNGLKLAVSVINKNGGADGHPINLHILDGASNATTGATATNQLLNQYNVVGMLNGASSATSVAIHPLLAEAKVPMITLSQLPPDHDWAFLSTTAFSRVMELELQFTTKHLKAKRIGIIYNLTPAAQSATKLLTSSRPNGASRS